MSYLAARIVLRFCIDSKCAPLPPVFKVAARAFDLFREFLFPGKYFASAQTHAGFNIEHGGGQGGLRLGNETAIRKHDAAELIATRKKIRVSQRVSFTCEISSVTRLENTPGNGAARDEGKYRNTRTGDNRDCNIEKPGDALIQHGSGPSVA